MGEITFGPPRDVRPDVVDHAAENLVNQIAHDIRNLAFAMGLQAELGARRAADPTTCTQHLEAVVRLVDKLKAYLEQLLLYGRPFQPQPVPLDPLALLREVVQNVGAKFSTTGQPPTVPVVAENHIGPVTWDRRGIHAALSALLDNALRSASSPPPVQVTLAAAGEWVRITVRDEGSGVDEGTLADLRYPMAVRRPGGLGLGVAIARKMICAHGGSLTITSGRGGTSVCVQLPRVVQGAG